MTDKVFKSPAISSQVRRRVGLLSSRGLAKFHLIISYVTPPNRCIIPQSTNRVADNLQKRKRFAEEAANNFPCDCERRSPLPATQTQTRAFFLRIWSPRFFCFFFIAQSVVWISFVCLQIKKALALRRSEPYSAFPGPSCGGAE